MTAPSDPRLSLRHGPMSSLQIAAVALCVVINMMDGFDILATGFTAPAIGSAFTLSPGRLGTFFGAGPAGMIVGAMFVAPFADRIGRRALVLLCLSCVTLGMALTAGAEGFAQLLASRGVTGIGVGAMMAAVNTVVAEVASDRRRDLAVCLQAAGFPAGGAVGGIAFYLLDGIDWRSIYAGGALLSLLLVPAVLRWLPDSLDYLIDRRPPGSLDRINRLLDRMALPPVAELPAPAGPAQANIKDALRLSGALAICGSFFLMMLSFYFLSSWVPKILTDNGLSARTGISASVMMSLGGVAGDVGFALLTLRWRARLLGPLFCLIALFAAIGVALCATRALPILPASLVLGIFLYGAMASHYALVPGLFPATARATGTGIALGIGRVGATIGPLLGGGLLAAGLMPVLSVSLMALPLGGCALLLLFLPYRALPVRSVSESL